MKIGSTPSGREISDLLPHSGEMVLIDRVIEWSGAEISCGTRSHVRASNPLRRGGGLYALAGIEYAGQAIALHASMTSETPLSMGMFASLRNLTWESVWLSDNTGELLIRARLQMGGRGGARYEFDLGFDGQVILAGAATVALFA